MTKLLSTLIAILGWSVPTLWGSPSPDLAPALFYTVNAGRNTKPVYFGFPPVFERERGVSWDGRIGWKTEERAWVFAAALEFSLKDIVRANSPYHLNVAVVRVEKQTGTFVVEFTIQDPSGESVELVQVEGTCPPSRSTDEVYPAVAGEIVTTFKKTVLQ